MAAGDVYLTREGFYEKNEEYDRLKARRRELSDVIEKARLLGDLRENAEYHAAKEAQSFNERRITELEQVLSRARIIDDEQIDISKALLGSCLKLRCLDDQEIEEYMLVSEAEADVAKGKISVASPLGKGLLGHRQGDVVTITVPVGVVSYEILEIAR